MKKKKNQRKINNGVIMIVLAILTFILVLSGWSIIGHNNKMAID